MRVLSIGNSFSTDAHKYLHRLAEINNINLETANLFIGGCSLETHWQNIIGNNAFYDYEINGNDGEVKSSILSALTDGKWDVITVQQVSNLSGVKDSYEPYFTNIVEFVKRYQPYAKLYFHQTWSYEIGSLHEGFLNYNKSQKQMYNQIVSVSEEFSKKVNAEIIPTGKVIQYLRENVPEFDYENGGISLCRDSFHLSYDYGRFAAATTWLRTLTDQNVEVADFENLDKLLLKKILNVVNNI